MRKSGSSVLKVAAVLVPMIVAGCSADGGGDVASGPAPDAVTAGVNKLGDKLPSRDLAPRATSIVDADGTEHVRFNQLFKGVPVFEGEAITHVKKNGTVEVTDALRQIKPNLDVTPKLTEAEAVAKAKGTAIGTATSKLMVLPSGDHDPQDRLAYYVRVSVDGELPAQWDTFVDAHTGKILLTYNTLLEAGETGHGKTAWSGNVDLEVYNNEAGRYSLVDSRGNKTCDLNNTTSGACVTVSTTNTETGEDGTVYGVFGNGLKDLSDRGTAAADAHYGMEKTLDYYLETFGRNGIDGLGTATTSRVHYSTKYDNAFWQDSCQCMTYGDGSTFNPLTSMDVAGHEMSHGVMSKEANLTYKGESGGLNESNSDIFGTLVEFYANSPNDPPDYLIGEGLYKTRPASTNFLRNMMDPAKDGSSPACWTTRTKTLDVHYSSGPNNHMFWLLSNPGANVSKCNGATVNGIGRDAAARIWYRAMSVYMTASTNYAGARVAALKAANDLFPPTAGVTSPEYKAVAAAYSAIKVN